MSDSLPLKRRRRGVFLSERGWQKLQDAKVNVELAENRGDRFTYEELSFRTQLDPRTVSRIMSGHEKVDKRSLEQFFRAFNLRLEKSDYIWGSPDEESPISAIAYGSGLRPIASVQPPLMPYTLYPIPTQRDLSEAADTTAFFGRNTQLTQLQQWLLDNKSQLVVLLGMGGIGKTALSSKLAHQIGDRFELVIWKSLRNAPSLHSLLTTLVSFLSQQQETVLPDDPLQAISRLMEYLMQHRCLLVLDNLESLFQSENRAGDYRTGYEYYAELFTRIAETRHQSCVLLTSRELPKEIKRMERTQTTVKILALPGVDETAGREILRTTATLFGADADWQAVVEHYAGNPLALQMIAASVEDYLNGDLSAFIQNLRQGHLLFDDIRDLLERQFNRLTPIEQSIMYWLAINREWTTVASLQAEIVPQTALGEILEAIDSLRRRSLIEKRSAEFTLQPVVMEYVSDRLIDTLREELRSSTFQLFGRHPLIKVTAPDYIQEAQRELLLTPLVNRLLHCFNDKQQLIQHLNQTLAVLRQRFALQSSDTSPEAGYAGGNLWNLLRHFQVELKDYDFSQLALWQADLRGFDFQGINLSQADFRYTALIEPFAGVHTIAFSPDGTHLAAGDTKGNIRIWQANGQPLLTFKGHTDWVGTVAFNADGNILLSGT